MSTAPKIDPARLLKVADSLPGAPRVLMELDHLLRDPNSDVAAIAAVLRRDIALTGRIVRIANGVIFSRGQPVGELEEALTRVGFGEVFRLISIASMLQMAEVQLRFYPISARTLRENALFSALLMETLAPLVGIDPRLAYTTGLLRSVGRIVLDVTAQRDLQITQVPPLPPEGLVEWEQALFGLTNYEAGYHVLKGWRFPFEVFVAVRDQLLHDLVVDALPNAKLLHVAVAASYGAGYAMPGGHFYLDRHAAKARADLGITEEQVATAVSQAGERFESLKAVLA